MQQLTQDEQQRYARHINLPGFGPEAQMKLKQSSVIIIGAGGLGSPIALYLAAAGIGTIAIADGDNIELSNLQRQIIHTTTEIGTPKAESAARKMGALNPGVKVITIKEYLTPQNIDDTLRPYQFVIDATDSLETKFLIDEACHRLHKPYNHGAIFRYEGQTMTILPGTARLIDLFPDGPQAVTKSETRGPLGVVPGILGTIQATEAIKHLTSIGTLLTNRLLRFNLLTMDFNIITLRYPDNQQIAKQQQK